MTWKQEIQKAERNKVFSHEAKIKVGPWGSCAIGERFELDKIVDKPVNAFMAELNRPDIYAFGRAFAEAVWRDDITKAKDCYEKIQKLAPLQIAPLKKCTENV